MNYIIQLRDENNVGERARSEIGRYFANHQPDEYNPAFTASPIFALRYDSRAAAERQIETMCADWGWFDEYQLRAVALHAAQNSYKQKRQALAAMARIRLYNKAAKKYRISNPATIPAGELVAKLKRLVRLQKKARQATACYDRLLRANKIMPKKDGDIAAGLERYFCPPA